MKKRYFTIILFVIFILFVALSSYNMVAADEIDQGTANSISTSIWGDAGRLRNVSSTIVSIIQWVGVMILIGAIIVKGIRYVSVSPDGKAEIKKEMIMLTVGAVLLFATTTILKLIIDLVHNSGL